MPAISPSSIAAADFHEKTATAYIRPGQIVAPTGVEHEQGSGIGKRGRCDSVDHALVLDVKFGLPIFGSLNPASRPSPTAP